MLVDAMADETGQPARQSPTTLIERELRGELPCVGCHYNLKGLSVKGLCPECGLAVRATLLAVVDPHASELQPIRYPRVVYGALVLWAVASLSAVCAVWAIRLTEMVAVSASTATPPVIGTLGRFVCVAWMAAAGGAALVAKPHQHLPSWTSRGVILAAVAYLGLAFVSERTLLRLDAAGAHSLFVASVSPGDVRTLWRCLEDLCAAGAVGGMSRLWGQLQARSVLMRSGRMDRQSTPSMFAAIGIMAAGDLLWLVAGPAAGENIENSVLRLVCQSLIGVGSMLLTVGLIAILLDVARLRGVMLAMPLSLEQLTVPEGGPRT